MPAWKIEGFAQYLADALLAEEMGDDFTSDAFIAFAETLGRALVDSTGTWVNMAYDFVTRANAAAFEDGTLGETQDFYRVPGTYGRARFEIAGEVAQAGGVGPYVAKTFKNPTCPRRGGD